MNPAFFEVRNYFPSIHFIYEKGNSGLRNAENQWEQEVEELKPDFFILIKSMLPAVGFVVIL